MSQRDSAVSRTFQNSKVRLCPWTAAALVVLLFPLSGTVAWGQTAGDLSISTYPVGLVIGELPVEVNLGATGTPADLYLDGQKACELSAAKTACRVDLGRDPHVHLLELVRPAASGRDVERAFRWINRPGQEAELLLRLSPANAQDQCEARVFTNHPRKQTPAVLEVLLDGKPLPFEANGAAIVPCPSDDESHILVASAIFPDARRVEDVRLIGGYVGRSESELTALPVLADEGGSCDSVQWPNDVVRVEEGNFEVVIVLDPKVPYQSIFKTGWHIGSGSSATSTTKAFDRVVGTEDSEMRPLATWNRAEVPFQTAEKLWYVAPGEGLPRINGFSSGKKNWLQLLFKFGMSDFPGNPRLADAVASSGLIAGAGPRRRAVILILSNKSKDDSLFTPQQATDYLAEVGVPLVVLRAGKPKGDGWPDGMKNSNISSMANNLEDIMEMIERQCVAWFEGGSRRPSQLSASLPSGFHVAGHGDAPPETLWDTLSAQELAALAGLEEPEVVPFERQFSGRLDLVSATVLVSAEDANGEPILDLNPAEVSVFEDEQPVQLVSLERLEIATPSDRKTPTTTKQPSPVIETEEIIPLPVSIYIEPALAGRSGMRLALKALAENAEKLTAVGPVEVVIGQSRAEVKLPETRDTSILASFLSQYEVPPPSRLALEDIRTRYIRDIRQIWGKAGSSRDDGEVVIAGSANIKMRTLAAAGEEFTSVVNSLEVLSSWVQSKEMGVPRLLLLVGTGFDENPREFYVPLAAAAEPQHVSELESRLAAFDKGDEVNKIARELAGNSWRVITVATGSTGGSTMSASERGSDRFQTFLTDGPSPNIQPGFFQLDPIGAQKRVARPSGGDVAMGASGLGSVLDRSTGWYRLTYQVERAPDGQPHTFSASSQREDIILRAPEVITSESSESRAENRLRNLLAGGSKTGLLTVKAKATAESTKGKKVSGILEIDTNLEPLQELMHNLGGGAFRVSVLMSNEGLKPSAAHQTVTLKPMAGFIHSLPLEWSKEATELAVCVEDLTSGEWGATRVDFTLSE